MSNFQMKWVAIITMFLDHLGVVLMDITPMAFYLRVIGRVAFPLFVFLWAEACLHTRDIKKYATRLGIFALISQLPFALLLQTPLWQSVNIFATLFMGTVLIWVFKSIEREKITHLLGVIMLSVVMVMAANLLNVDYGGTGIILMLWLYQMREQFPQNTGPAMLVAGIGMFIIYPLGSWFFWAGLLSLVPMWRYNHQLGYKKMKWLFYSFYPAHLLALGLWRLMM